MTKKLYLIDSYQKEFDATVTTVNGTHISLNQTCFYATGGGQPHDTGTLLCDGVVYTVITVKKSDDNIIHEVDKEGLQEGDSVHGKINWERRYTLMRYHTSAHIVSAVTQQKTSVMITGNELNVDKARIDFSLENFNRETLEDSITEANKIVQQDLPVRAAFIQRSELEKYPDIFKLAKQFPEHIQKIRVISIGDFDRQADGGTHVTSTKEVGVITLQKLENKGKGRKRVYYTLDSSPL